VEYTKAAYTYAEANCQTVSEKKGKPDNKGKYEWIAGAEPQCYAFPKGKYTESACLTSTGNKKGEPKGEYEKTVPVTFKVGEWDAVGRVSLYECRNSEHRRVREPRADCAEYEPWFEENEPVCERSTLSGEAVGRSEVANVVLDLRCDELEGTNIVLHGKGRLGYIAKNEVGLLLEFEPSTYSCLYESGTCIMGAGNATEGAFYKPEATGGYDGIIGTVTLLNKMTERLDLQYRTSAIGEEEPNSFEGEHIDELEWAVVENQEGFPSEWSPFGFMGEPTLLLSSQVEIKD
jgi:hypothetical protein